MVAGFANKVTAADLGTSEITIGVHRGQIMRKMGARSLAELVTMARTLGINDPWTRIKKHPIASHFRSPLLSELYSRVLLIMDSKKTNSNGRGR